LRKRNKKVEMNKQISILIVLVGLLCGNMHAQVNPDAKKILEQRGEIIIKFIQPSFIKLPALSRMMSIDNYIKRVEGNEISAYLNQKEFEQFEKLNISYEIVVPPTIKSTVTMCSNVDGVKAWNCYPTYGQYVQLMESFVTNYPNLCKLVEFGKSVDGRKLLALKISDNVNIEEEEPGFFYTSTMHGNETTGYILMLRLIDYLLKNYDTDARISTLVNTTEIWINPNSNPDGTYYLGDNIIDNVYSRRNNNNGVDLNRNFPGFDYVDAWPNVPRYPIVTQEHTDGNVYQPETLAMMDFMKAQPFVFSANLHGGAEVVNYPWDAWESIEKVHADDAWYQEISREYADTVHANSNGYLLDLDNGITNGADWYYAFGTRQDYVNYYLHSRETTIEISTVKTPLASTLPNYWNYNYRSFLNYINRVHTGIYGKIVDQDGTPLKVKIHLEGYDYDSSQVYSNASNGMYYRMLQDGSYRVYISNYGYSVVDTVVAVVNQQPTELNLVLRKWPTSVQVLENGNIKVLKFNNPVQNVLKIDFELKKACTYKLELFDIAGKKVMEQSFGGVKGLNQIQFNTANLKQGVYFCKIYSDIFMEKIKFVKLNDL